MIKTDYRFSPSLKYSSRTDVSEIRKCKEVQIGF
jgi:hypothetical protein